VKVRSLREVIDKGGCSSSDAAELQALLAEIDDAELDEFVAAIKTAVAKVASSLARRRAALEEGARLIGQVVAELERTKHDNSAFEQVVERMKKSKAIKPNDASEIASRYLGAQHLFKSKTEAAKAILKRQIGDKRASNRQARVHDIF
jgi:ribosomal protein L12E/L44/L45/RPP1/RPP2